MYLKLLSLEESMSGLIEIKSVPCMLSLSLFEGTCGGNLRRAKKSGTDRDGGRNVTGLWRCCILCMELTHLTHCNSFA